MQHIAYLKGTVKHYDWGGNQLIPSLLQLANEEHKPFAEYWMGVHPLADCSIEDAAGNKNFLTDVINKNKEAALGKAVNQLFGNLPYLLKLLDVKEMLSIQVHPSKAAAAIEFARENAEGISVDSPQRNYKDANHKPELMVALSDFWLLHGFKPAEELVYTLLNVVELRELLPVFNDSGYAGLYQYVMEMSQSEVNRILQPLLDNISSIYKDEDPDRMDEDFWVARAAKTFNKEGNIDRGIFSIYLFNLVFLKKGEGIFQDAGVPHAYLEGQNVEIMANSDNVLRGGLTTKHIDVNELLKHVKCEPTYPNILSGSILSGMEKIYLTPAPDFCLSVFELEQGATTTFLPVTAEALVITEGILEITDGTDTIILEEGKPSGMVFSGKEILLKAASKATVFRASVAVHNGE